MQAVESRSSGRFLNFQVLPTTELYLQLHHAFCLFGFVFFVIGGECVFFFYPSISDCAERDFNVVLNFNLYFLEA